MKIAYVHAATPSRHSDERDLNQMVKKSSWLGDIASYVARLGHDVSVHVIYPQKGIVQYKGVTWFFCKPDILNRYIIGGKEPSISLLLSLAKRRPDIIHFHYIITWNYAMVGLLAKFLNIPMVVQHHGEVGSPRDRRFYNRLSVQSGLNNSQKVIFLTEQHQKFYHERYRIQRSMVLSVGYCDYFYKVNKRLARKKTKMSGDPIILWVAYLVPRKDPEIVLDAFENIAPHFPEAKFYMVGSGPLQDKIGRRVKGSRELKRSVILKGHIPNQELNMVYNSADIYVLASHSEGIPVSSLEAMAGEVAPVVTDLPGFRKASDGGKYGLLFPPGDRSALEKQLIRLIKDKELRKSIAAGASKWVSSNFSWGRVAESLVGLYSEILQKRQR